MTTTILYLDEFWSDWRALGYSVETDLWDLENELLKNPKIGKVVQGACGLRKVRFAPRDAHYGKSHGARVAYAYLEAIDYLIFVQAYDHSTKDNLSAAEKKQVCKALHRLEKSLEEGISRQKE